MSRRDQHKRQVAHFYRYVERLDRRIARYEQQSLRYSRTRLVIIAVGVVLGTIAYQLDVEPLFLFIVGLTFVAFVVVAAIHRRLDEGIRRHRKWKAIKSTHLARLDLRWELLPREEIEAPPADHPFGIDLDLLGPRSLHHLMDTAVSLDGSRRLAHALLDTEMDVPHMDERQALVSEVAARPLFRDKIALTATLAPKRSDDRWSADPVTGWIQSPAPDVRSTLLILVPLSLLTISLFALNILGIVGPYWILTFVVYFWIFFQRSKRVSHLLTTAMELYDGLDKFRRVFRFLEEYRYHDARHLAALCEPFHQSQSRPSRHLRRVSRIAAAAGVQSNPLLWLVVNAIVPWDYIFMQRLNSARVDFARYFPGWLDTWTEVELLNAIGTFAALHPHYQFPGVLEGGDEAVSLPLFDARELGHPLIPESQKVVNDFAIERAGRLFILTGSNMSGKSTFLRTIGINICLARAGAPVDASHLQMRAVRLFTCIKVSDSVIDGVSYFYAEVKRLRRLLAELDRPDPVPLLFLIDEIFRGTNNRERLIGGRSFIKALAERNGTGLISTHDLELVHLEQEIDSISNMHFREDVVDGKMLFDYRLRPGPCPTTNALKIMKMEGLPVEQADR